MKSIFFFFAVFISTACFSQTFHLNLSNPQPRLGESFYVSFKADTLSKQIFMLSPKKFKINTYTDFTAQETSLSVQLEALKIGYNEIGPFTFNFNGHVYKTSVLKFIIADSLPKIDRGVWIRKVAIDDTTVYVMIDQRIPAHNQITQKDSNTITMSAEVNDNEKEVNLLKENTVNAKIEDWGSSSQTTSGFWGKGLSYGSFYKCYKVTVLSKSLPLILTKAAFENLPDYFKFQDININ